MFYFYSYIRKPLKTLENRFSNVFREYKSRTLVEDGLIDWLVNHLDSSYTDADLKISVHVLNNIFAFLIMRIPKLFPCKFLYFFLKIRLLFNVFYCFCMFVIKNFTNFTGWLENSLNQELELRMSNFRAKIFLWTRTWR